jgi:hypothetical protein
MVDLRVIAKNLIEGEEWVLTTLSHQNAEFMHADWTDWQCWRRFRSDITTELIDTGSSI